LPFSVWLLHNNIFLNIFPLIKSKKTDKKEKHIKTAAHGKKGQSISDHIYASENRPG